MEVFEVALDGASWRIVGDTVRFDGQFSAEKDVLTGLWELKDKKLGWQPWIKLKLARA
jgi:hypothetical protein